MDDLEGGEAVRVLLALVAMLLWLAALLAPLYEVQSHPAWPGRVALAAPDQGLAGPLPEPLDGRTTEPDQPPFREGLLQMPATFVPLVPGGDNPVTQLIYRGLAQLGPDGAPRPDLAEGWQDLGGTEWIVRLKSDLTWQDGQPVTADDVVFTLQSAAHPSLRDWPGPEALTVRRRALLWASRQVEALDPLTVRITLDRPDGSIPYDLTLPLVPAHVLRSAPDPRTWPDSALARAPVGTGAYRWVEGGREGISLEAWPRQGRWPRLSGFRFLPMAGESAGLRALREGKLDGVVLDAEPRLEAASERSDPGLVDKSWPSATLLLLTWSGGGDPALRRALAPALAGASLWPPYPGADAGAEAGDESPSVRLAEAGQALNRLGWMLGSDGLRHRGDAVLSVTLTHGGQTDGARAALRVSADAVAQQLRALGAATSVVAVDARASLAGAVPADRPEPAHTAPAGGQPEGALQARLLLWQAGGDPDLVNLLDQVPGGVPDHLRSMALAARGETATLTRWELWRSAAAGMAEEGLVTPLARGRQTLVTARPLHNFTPNPFNFFWGVATWHTER